MYRLGVQESRVTCRPSCKDPLTWLHSLKLRIHIGNPQNPLDTTWFIAIKTTFLAGQSELHLSKNCFVLYNYRQLDLQVNRVQGNKIPRDLRLVRSKPFEPWLWKTTYNKPPKTKILQIQTKGITKSHQLTCLEEASAFINQWIHLFHAKTRNQSFQTRHPSNHTWEIKPIGNLSTKISTQ